MELADRPRGIMSLGMGLSIPMPARQSGSGAPAVAAGAGGARAPASAAASRAPAAARAASPNYQAPTAVQPKAPLQECPHASEEGVAAAFAAGGGAGIRSLPNALVPGFREVLYAQLVGFGRMAQQLRASTTSSSSAAAGAAAAAASSSRHPQPPARPRGLHGGGLGGRPRGAGGTLGGGGSTLRLPSRYSPEHGYFSSFAHAGDDYGGPSRAASQARLQSKAAQVAAADFVVRGSPPQLRGTPAFGALATAERRPYVETDHLGRPCDRDQQLAAAALHGAFVPPGRGGGAAAALKARAGELLAALGRQVARDFPASFLQAFQDSRGAIVISFSRSAAAAEGDVAAYMAQQAKAGELALQFRLSKDASHWGFVEDAGDTVFYALWPPWRPHRPDTGSLARPPVSNPEAAGDDDDIDYEAGSGGVTGGARGESPVLRRVATAARGLASPAGGDGGGRGLL